MEPEIRSEELNEILGKAPNWIIRTGIMVVFIVVALLIAGSCFFKYPDIMSSTIMLTSENVPANIVAKTDGKITALFVKDKQQVKKNEALGIIENTAVYDDVLSVCSKLDSLKPFLMDIDLLKKCNVNFDYSYSLGDMQTEFSAFRKSLQDYLDFISLDYQHKKIASLQSQICKYKQMCGKLESRQDIMRQKLALGGNQLNRDSLLYSNQSIALSEFEKTKSARLDDKYVFSAAATTIDNALIEINQLEQTILETQQDYAEKKNAAELLLKEAYDNLQSQVKLWEQTYVLKSPVAGIVSFTKFWNVNQNVATGDMVMTVVPSGKSLISGKLSVPAGGSGKVKPGQKVNIKFESYPYMEFGMVRGTVKSLSLVPAGNNFIAEVELPEGLKTSYGKQLEYTQEMQGKAEIITDDLKLIERVLNPVRAVMMK